MRFLLFLVLTAALTTNIQSQDFSNKGREFWIPYSYHVNMASTNLGGLTMTLYMTSDVTTDYTVEIYGGSVIQTGTIQAGQVVTAIVPTTNILNTAGLITGKTVRVTATKPIAVYSYVTASAISGATVCLPTNVLGKEYISTNYTQISNSNNSNSFFTIIAVEDNTTVEIIPSAPTTAGWAAGSVNQIQLKKGEIYQVLGRIQGTPTPVGSNNWLGDDLTGSRIRTIATGTETCKRIAVFSGAGKMRIGVCTNSNSSDNLYQQLYPTASWGKNYLTVPSFNRTMNFYRIIRSVANGKVFLNGTEIPAASFVNGSYYEFSNNTPNYITSEEPVSVVQYFTTQGCSGNTSPYDPDMIILNPIEQNISKVTLVSSNLVAAGPQHHIHVIMPKNGTGITSFKFDGNAVPTTNWITHPANSNYAYLYLSNVQQGYHTLQSDSGFNALAYGYASAESYGYSAGSNIKDLYQFASIRNINAVVPYPTTCKNTPFNFAMTFPYEPTKINWVFGTKLNAQGINDTIINAPQPDSTYLIDGKKVFEYRLPNAFKVGTPDIYPVRILATPKTKDDCGSDQEINFNLEVLASPSAGFTSIEVCKGIATSFTDTSDAGQRNIIKYLWEFGDGQKGEGKTINYTYADSGRYNVKHSFINDLGCISDEVTQSVYVKPLPTAQIKGDTSVCKNTTAPVITFTGSKGAAPFTFAYSINGGTAQQIKTITGDTVSVSVPTNTDGKFTYQLISVTEGSVNTCNQNQTGSSAITIWPLPEAKYQNSAIVCETGVVSFTDISIPKGGSITAWKWDFNDPVSGVDNESTSNKPVHSFTKAGSFDVKLTVTNSNGCVSDNAITPLIVHPKPVAGFIIPEVCLKDTYAEFLDSSKVAGTSTITSWAWNFGDANWNQAPVSPNTSTQKNARHSYKAIGDYMVNLMIISSEGCRDTIEQKLTVNGSFPVAAFTVQNPTTLCANDSVVIVDGSTVFPGVITKVEIWWDDNGDKTIKTVDDNPVFGEKYKFLYPNFQSPLSKTYKIRYRAYSGGVCMNETSQTITLNAAPKVTFSAIPTICFDAAPYQIIQAKEVGNVPGSFQFFGPGVSSSGVFQPAKAGAGIHTIKYIFTSTTGSCSDSITQTIKVWERAIADFTITTTPICEKQAVTFNDKSTSSEGTITEWQWDFGDGTPAEKRNTAAPFTHIFPHYGNYMVKLIVVTSNGCSSAVKTMNVTVEPLARPNFSFPDTSCLPNAIVQFINRSSVPGGTTANLKYVWDFGDPASGGSNTSSIADPAHTYVALGPFNVKLQVTTAAGCIHDSTIVLNSLHPEPIGAFTTSVNEVCVGGAIQFTNTSDPKDGSLQSIAWKLGDGNVNTSASFSHTYARVGTYTVELYIINSFGCKSSVATKNMVINPYPTVDAGPDRVVLEGGFITINATASNAFGLTYQWNPPTGLKDATILTPVASPSQDTRYILTVTSDKGCADTSSMFLKVLFKPIIPNTFTPNGDGYNDNWDILYLDSYPGAIVEVYSDVGQLIFQSRGYSKPWDGTFNGKLLPAGTYYYVVDPKNKRAKMAGYVTILR
ncbi:MAG: hypothetical protein RL335_252 [Bacteroidota bacterium]